MLKKTTIILDNDIGQMRTNVIRMDNNSKVQQYMYIVIY